MKRAVEIAPDFLAAWIDLSRAQLERLDLPAARASIERAAQLNPRSANVQIHVANVQARSGQHAEAVETYRRAIELNPDLPAGYLRTRQYAEDDRTPGGGHRRPTASATVLRPEQSEAWWSLSNLKTFRFEDADIEAMQQQLESADIARRSPRPILLRARQGAARIAATIARAFELYERGNRTRRDARELRSRSRRK